MKKIVFCLTTLALVACSGSFQTNKTQRQTILRSKFNQDLPQWVLDSADSRIIEENGKTYFVSEIVRSERSNNTAQLERAASLDAGSQLAAMAAQQINTVVKLSENDENIRDAKSSIQAISETNIQISTIVPTSTYWQLIEYAEGDREYHAFAKVRVNSQEIVDAMAKAFVSANPDVKEETAKTIVVRSATNMNLDDVKPDEKIF
nr:hypothetical protein [Candidatus Enterousia merdequi]